MKGLSVWIFSKQAMLLFLFGLFFILYNFLMVLNNAVDVLESNTILYKISDAYSQVTLMNVKKINLNLPLVLEKSISTKTKKFETPYKIYIFNENGRVYFIFCVKKGNEFYNISGISFKGYVGLYDCGNNLEFDEKKCKKQRTLVYDPKETPFLTIEKTSKGVVVYVQKRIY